MVRTQLLGRDLSDCRRQHKLDAIRLLAGIEAAATDVSLPGQSGYRNSGAEYPLTTPEADVLAWPGNVGLWGCQNCNPLRMTEDLEILSPRDCDKCHSTRFCDANGKCRRRRYSHKN